MTFWPFPGRTGAFAAALGLLVSHWCSPLTSATVAVAVLWALLVAQK